MKATGEVMAIDRTFGAALNKALRGLEQAGAGPMGEDPSWGPTFDYLAAVYAGIEADEGGAGLDGLPADDAPIRWTDERGQACESSRFAQRSAAPIVLRQFLEPSDSRLWRVLGLLRRGVPQEVVRRATGISAWFLAEMGRNVALEADVRAMGPRLVDPEDRRGRRAARHGQAGRRSRIGTWPLLAGMQEAAVRGARIALGLVPGYAMVDTCAAEFAAETPYFYSTYASCRLAARGGPGRAPGGPGHRLRPRADRAGDRVRLLRRPCRRRAPPRGLERRDGQLQPRDGLDGLRRVHAPLLRAARPGERAQHHRVRERRHGAARGQRGRHAAGRRRVRGPDAAQPGRVPGGGRGPAAGLGPRGHRPGGGADPVLRAAGPAGHPAARRRHGRVHRGGADPRRAHRLPGHRAAVVRHRRARDRLRLLAGGPRKAPGGGRDRGPGPARPHRPLPRGHRGGRRRRLRRHRGADPGPPRARRAGRRPLRRLHRRVPAAAREPGRPGPGRGHDGAHLPGPRRPGPGQCAVHRPR